VKGGFPLVSSSGISDTHYKSAVRGPGVVTGRSGSIGNVFFMETEWASAGVPFYGGKEIVKLAKFGSIETRAEHIDPALAAAGWGVVEGSRVRREYPITLGRLEGHGRRGKPLTADYVLVCRNTMMAVVEAKAWDQALTEGVGQAKNYAYKLAIRFAYSSNGQGVYGIDMQTGREGEIPAFPTPDELWNRTFAKQNDWRDRFAAVPFPDKSGSWVIRQRTASPRPTSATIPPTFSTSSSSTSVTAAAPMTREPGAASWNTSPRRCSWA
jgi:hypothetical protein